MSIAKRKLAVLLVFRTCNAGRFERFDGHIAKYRIFQHRRLKNLPKNQKKIATTIKRQPK